ncbi:MAG TPA: hypothetical protein VI383_10770, partial [Gemmatimonadales bacterium]|nr:hypothetical protein [Gemmatimonadales bacterium]
PGHLTVSVALDLEADPAGGGRGGGAVGPSGAQRPASPDECAGLLERLLPGTDFSREIVLTRSHQLGDVTVTRDPAGLAGFALWHSAPLSEGKSSPEIRVLKLAASDQGAFQRLIQALEAKARETGIPRIGIRCQTAYRQAYGDLLQAGFRVHWTDLRMTLEGGPEAPALGEGIVFSNWEI